MPIDGQSILVTGGTGSFGKAFAKVLIEEYAFEKLIVFSRDELKQSEMRQEIGDSRVRYFIGDVRDGDRLRRAMNGVNIVVHAAALKQVDTCEYNPVEAILTNVMGARNVIEAALDQKVERVVGLSTDKAVNPLNLYGATKLCAEKLFVQSNSYSGAGGTKFSCTRYGNVVGSRGSVVPIFEQQRQNGTVTITDPRMTRFWMTLEQGVRFVIHCIDIMRGGEVFVPKIPSMNLLDLKEAVAPECDVEEVGIRPGEKLHEVLLSEDESRLAVELDDMFIVRPPHRWWGAEEAIPGAETIKDEFRYASDSNDQWLTVEKLREMLAP